MRTASIADDAVPTVTASYELQALTNKKAVGAMPIYLGARDLSGMFVGTHQFLVLVSDTLLVSREVGFDKIGAKFLGKNSGKNIYGIVIGAQNRGTLNVEFFEKSDYTAALEFFGGSPTSWYKSDFDTEMYEVGSVLDVCFTGFRDYKTHSD